MYRPVKPLGFDIDNPEHALVDAMTEEMHELESAEIIYWKLKKFSEVQDELNATPSGGEYLDELDKTYGEKSSGDATLRYEEPQKVSGKMEKNPIIHELSRMGLLTIEEIDFYVNIAHIHSKLETAPGDGDVFRVTFMIKDANGDLKDRYVYYKVSNITPVDLFMYQYVNYQIRGEQTNMVDVPSEILNHYIDNEYK